MASFLLGVLTGMAIEEICRYGYNKLRRFTEAMESLPDVDVGGMDNEDEDKAEVKVLKDENNISK